MKKILLKSLSLVNFKGVRDFSITFNDGITTVCGDNGTGKTTLYDAYLWLLFGKDSTGRKTKHSISSTMCAQAQRKSIKLKYPRLYPKMCSA